MLLVPVITRFGLVYICIESGFACILLEMQDNEPAIDGLQIAIRIAHGSGISPVYGRGRQDSDCKNVWFCPKCPDFTANVRNFVMDNPDISCVQSESDG